MTSASLVLAESVRGQAALPIPLATIRFSREQFVKHLCERQFPPAWPRGIYFPVTQRFISTKNFDRKGTTQQSEPLTPQHQGQPRQNRYREPTANEFTHVSLTPQTTVTVRDEAGSLSLHLAAENVKVDIVECLLMHGADFDAKTNGGATPLHAACAKGRADVVKILLERGASAKEDRSKLLEAAAASGSVDSIELLVRHCDNMTLDNKVLEAALLARQRDVADWLMDQGTLLETRAPGILSVLYFAATNGHNDVVEWLLKHGCDVNETLHGSTLLHFAILNNKSEIVCLLLERGADPNARNSREMTVLGLACNLREAELAKILLQQGADANLPAVGSTSPILMAALYGDLEILRILHQNGGSIAHSSAMSSPMVAACMSGQAEVIEYLLDHDVDVNGKLEGGMTPIFYAVLLNRLDIAEVLFWNGANLDATTHQDRTLLHLVAEKGNAEAIKWLLQHAAENDARDDMNMTPLHHACNGGHADAARVLLANGAEVNERDDNDQTPLVHAVRSGHLAAMMVLVEHGVNLTAASDQDKSALSLAAQEGNLGGVRWLFEYAKIDAHFVGLSLMDSFRSGSPEVAEFLLDNGLVKGNLAYDWLEQAGRFGEVEIVEMILSRLPERVFSGEGYPGRDWANVMAIALHAAVQHSHLEVVRVLLDYGVAVDALAVDVLGYRCLWTALHHACQSGNHVMVRALVEAGADVRAVTDPTRAPKDYPYGSETTKIKEFLKGWVNSRLACKHMGNLKK